MNTAWQVDLHRLAPNQWRLLALTPQQHVALTAQPSVVWVAAQLATWSEAVGTPSQILGFRPETWPMLAAAAGSLQWPAVPQRLCHELQAILKTEQPELVTLSENPPNPCPYTAERWQFGRLAARDLLDLAARPIPFGLRNLQRAAHLQGVIPGVIFTAGRQARYIAQWLDSQIPAYCEAITGDPDGVVIHTGLADRWVLATYTDAEVVAAAARFQSLKQAAQGWHFVVVQPDQSGLTFTGLWLLREYHP